MSEQANEFRPAVVVAAHDALHNTFNRVVGWAEEHGLGKKIAALTVVGGLALSGCSNKEGDASHTTGTIGATGTTTPGTVAPGICEDTWPIKQANAADTHRYEADGIQAIKDAQEGSSEDALEGFNAWFDMIKQDPELLAGTANALLHENVTAADLQDAQGTCATPRAQELSTKFIASVQMSGDQAPNVTNVPENATNTGTDANGNVVVAAQSGITGDRKGIQVTISTTDGTETFYILGRCGNIVLPPGVTPPIPGGPTDEPEPKHDDGRLPGNPNVPADQDHGIIDVPGNGPAGQTPGPDGYVPGETRPTAPPTTAAPTTTTTERQTTATTSPQPTSTQPPVSVTTPPTTKPQGGMPGQP